MKQDTRNILIGVSVALLLVGVVGVVSMKKDPLQGKAVRYSQRMRQLHGSSRPRRHSSSSRRIRVGDQMPSFDMSSLQSISLSK